MQAQINYILDKLEHGKTLTGFRGVLPCTKVTLCARQAEEYFRSPVADILLDTNNEGMTFCIKAATGCVGVLADFWSRAPKQM